MEFKVSSILEVFYRLYMAYSTMGPFLVHLHQYKINAAMFHSLAYHRLSRLVSSHLNQQFYNMGETCHLNESTCLDS